MTSSALSDVTSAILQINAYSHETLLEIGAAPDSIHVGWNFLSRFETGKEIGTRITDTVTVTHYDTTRITVCLSSNLNTVCCERSTCVYV